MISLLVALLAPAHAAPGVVPIQGVLTDSAGTPVDGDVSVTFRLVTNDTGSIEVWTDTVTVAASNGRFAVDLGANASLDLALFADHPAMHLGVSVESDSEMPLVPMNHVPYAAWAEEAGAFGGQTAAEFQTTLLDTTDSRYMSSTYLPNWGSLTGVPSDLLDGDDNTTYSGSDFAISNQFCGPNAIMVGIGPTGGILCETISEVGYAPAWGDLTGVPTGLDDGDNDTTYSAGLGLELSGTELYISEYAGGPLIPNARFESGFTGWSVANGAAGAVTTVTDGQAGSAVYRATTGQNPWLSSDARIAVRPGQNYRVSGAFRRTDTIGNAGAIYLAVRAFDSAGNNITGDGA